MADEDLTFSIRPDDGELTFDALYRTVEDIRKLIHDVDATVSQNRTRRARRWYITGFHSSDPTITLRPASDGTDSGIRAVSAVVDGIKWIGQPDQTVPPPYFAERELEDLKNMRRLRSSGVSRVDFLNGTEASVVPSRVEEQVDRILRSGDEEYGSIEGLLDAVNLHRVPMMTVWDSITGLAVRCSFPRDFDKTVRELLTKRVRVSGLVHYFADGRPKSVSDFRGVEDLTPAASLRSAYFGAIPHLTDGLGSERHLSIVRDDEEAYG